MSAIRRFAAAMAIVLGAGAATATEYVTFEYDALGRLVKVARATTGNSGAKACYSYDRADNRTNVTVANTGCEASPPPSSPPSFSISNASAVEGGALAFAVTKTSSAAASVSYATANGSATSTSDYYAASGTLAFGPTETSRTISVSTRQNTIVESAESFYVNLSAPTGGATIADSQGVGTINDNDSGGGGGGGDDDPCPLCVIE